MEDDFNPYQTMSIASLGAASIPNPNRGSSTRRVNITEDIDGARPKQYYRHNIKREFFHDTKDIEGAQPRGPKTSSNRPNFVNATADIEGAQSKPSIFKTTRTTDPLEPQYPLPKAEPIKPVELPFRRDNMQVDDIEGAKPAKYFKWKTRPINQTEDIPGSHPSWKPQHKQLLSGRPRNAGLDVSDIVQKKANKPRQTDTLSPQYSINGMKIADDPASKPKEGPKQRNEPSLALETRDIEGAYPGWKPSHGVSSISESQRRQWRETNAVQDIDGAQAGTRRTGLRSKRITDPNARDYPSLEGETTTAAGLPFQATAQGSADALGVSASVRRLADPRDAEIESLRAEVEELRKSMEIQHLENEVQELRRVKNSSASSLPPRPPPSAMSVSSANSRSRGDGHRGASTAAASRGSQRSAATPTTPQARLTPEPRSGRSDSNGVAALSALNLPKPPRSAASVASRASAASFVSRGSGRSTGRTSHASTQRSADIQSVRDLPDSPASYSSSRSTTLSLAGSQALQA